MFRSFFNLLAIPLRLLLTRMGITTSQDKAMHFIIGFSISLGIALSGVTYTTTFINILNTTVEPIHFTSIILGLIAGVGAGVLKEIIDQIDYKGANAFDLFATIAGTVVGVFVYGILDALHLV